MATGITKEVPLGTGYTQRSRQMLQLPFGPQNLGVADSSSSPAPESLYFHEMQKGNLENMQGHGFA